MRLSMSQPMMKTVLWACASAERTALKYAAPSMSQLTRCARSMRQQLRPGTSRWARFWIVRGRGCEILNGAFIGGAPAAPSWGRFAHASDAHPGSLKSKYSAGLQVLVIEDQSNELRASGMKEVLRLVRFAAARAAATDADPFARRRTLLQHRPHRLSFVGRGASAGTGSIA